MNADDDFGNYNLGPDGRTPVPCSMLAWDAARRSRKREAGNDPWRVALTELPGDVRISTVFLGLDHSFGMGDTPILFETMIFGLKDEYCERYSTWDEAEAGHRVAVEFAKT